jgi:hypothetical protein
MHVLVLYLIDLIRVMSLGLSALVFLFFFAPPIPYHFVPLCIPNTGFVCCLVISVIHSVMVR